MVDRISIVAHADDYLAAMRAADLATFKGRKRQGRIDGVRRWLRRWLRG